MTYEPRIVSVIYNGPHDGDLDRQIAAAFSSIGAKCYGQGCGPDENKMDFVLFKRNAATEANGNGNVRIVNFGVIARDGFE